MMVTQLVKKSPEFYGARSFIGVFTGSRPENDYSYSNGFNNPLFYLFINLFIYLNESGVQLHNESPTH
jgi:hypothetical protein